MTSKMIGATLDWDLSQTVKQWQIMSEGDKQKMMTFTKNNFLQKQLLIWKDQFEYPSKVCFN